MAKKPQADAPTQTFKCRTRVLHSDGEFAPGDEIDLTRADFDELKPLGAIEGEWRATPAAPKA